MAFNPTMPHPIPVPWPAPWDGVIVVYDLYRCERYIDEQAEIMAASRAAWRALEAEGQAIAALDDGPDKSAADTAWGDRYTAWLRADRLQQVQYFVLRVEWPDGTISPGKEAATWEPFPTKLLKWLADDGFLAARDALWAHPKAPPEPPPAAP